MKKRVKLNETVITEVDRETDDCRKRTTAKRKNTMKSEFFTENWALRKLMTADNIKKFAFAVTLLLISYHGILRLKSGLFTVIFY